MQFLKPQVIRFRVIIAIGTFLILLAGLLFLQRYWMYANRPDVFSISLNLTYQVICLFSFLPWILLIGKSLDWIRRFSPPLWLQLIAGILIFAVITAGQFFWSSLWLFLADLIPSVYFPRYLGKYLTEWVHVYFLLFVTVATFYWKGSKSKSGSSSLKRVNGNTRIEVKENGEVELLDYATLDYVEAIDHYQKLFVGDRFYLTKRSMVNLEKHSPDYMVRVHRSFIVNMNHVAYLKSLPGQQYSIVLKDGRVIKVGKTYTRKVVEMVS